MTTLDTFKAQANNLGALLASHGVQMKHTHLLHALAAACGSESWNHLKALGAPPHAPSGQRLRDHMLRVHGIDLTEEAARKLVQEIGADANEKAPAKPRLAIAAKVARKAPAPRLPLYLPEWTDGDVKALTEALRTSVSPVIDDRVGRAVRSTLKRGFATPTESERAGEVFEQVCEAGLAIEHENGPEDFRMTVLLAALGAIAEMRDSEIEERASILPRIVAGLKRIGFVVGSSKSAEEVINSGDDMASSSAEMATALLRLGASRDVVIRALKKAQPEMVAIAKRLFEAPRLPE